MTHALRIAASATLATIAIASMAPMAGAQSAATLRRADSALSAASAHGVRDALIAAMADDAVLLYPGQPIVRGRAAIARLLDSLPNAGAERVTWQAMRAEVSADATRGYTYGRGVSTRDTTAPASGMHYIAWWRRDGDRWVVAAWLFQRTRADARSASPDTLSPWPCATIAGARPPLPQRDPRAAVLAADMAFAARADTAMPAVAFAEYAADDGVSLGARPAPACGKTEIGAEFDGNVAGDLRWAPSVADAAASGDLGYTLGSATIRAVRGTFHSKYLTVWKRQSDGSWRFVADGGNPMAAAPSAAR